jgi:hypothetical protein
MARLKIIDVVEESNRAVPEGPPPPESLGHNLLTLSDAEHWLMHPKNWVQSDMEIVYWNGNIPKLGRRAARNLLENPLDKPGLFAVIIREQYDLKHPKKEEKETNNTTIE